MTKTSTQRKPGLRLNRTVSLPVRAETNVPDQPTGNPQSGSSPRPETASAKRLQVFKFGGTSVNGATCLSNVAAIIEEATRESAVVTVVSAMSGVTDRLLQAATAAAKRERPVVAEVLNQLRLKHLETLVALIRSTDVRASVAARMGELFATCDQMCEEVVLSGRLTPVQRDWISALGERISAPLLSAALLERGVPSEALDATEFVVTDSNYGAAEPLMDRTRELSNARLRPLIARGVVPVITGFIGATPDGALTTLGRGGSDYSATIVAAALDADEVVIWTDVDGLMTADPRIVPGTRLISEVSYQEASELASFGAKILHPKTVSAIKKTGAPLWIRNTSAPQVAGTKITPKDARNDSGVRALTSTDQVCLIRVKSCGAARLRQLNVRAADVLTRVHAVALLFSTSGSEKEINIAVPSSCAQAVRESLQVEFERECRNGTVQRMELQSGLGLVTAVGLELSKIVAAARQTIETAGARVMISSLAESDSRVSFLMRAEDVARSVVALHRQFVIKNVRSETGEKRIPLTELEAYGAD